MESTSGHEPSASLQVGTQTSISTAACVSGA
jgi:hypothetical protein